MRSIRWTIEASDQFEEAIRYIQRDSPAAARRVAKALFDRIEQLAKLPDMGRLGEVDGTRELPCPPYVVVYRAAEEVIEILYIWHGTQDWR